MTNRHLEDKTFSGEHVAHSSFTTSRKNKGNSPIRRRCLELIDAAKALSYEEEMPLEDAIFLFRRTPGIVDRASIRAYFGTQPHKSIRLLNRMASYASGIRSQKTIELSQNVGYSSRYFEILSLASIQKKGNTWFMISNEASIIPILVPYTSENVNRVVPSNVDLSLSPDTQDRSSSSNHSKPSKTQLDTTTTDRQQHTLLEERERKTMETES